MKKIIKKAIKRALSQWEKDYNCKRLYSVLAECDCATLEEAIALAKTDVVLRRKLREVGVTFNKRKER